MGMPEPSHLQVSQWPRLQPLWVSFLPPTLHPVRPEALGAILKAHIQGACQGASRAWTRGPGTVTSVPDEACQGLITPSILPPPSLLGHPHYQVVKSKRKA